MKLKIGDVVELKSGSMPMTIFNIIDSGVCVVWSVDNSELRKEIVSVDALKIYK